MNLANLLFIPAESMFRVKRQVSDTAGENINFGGADDETDPPPDSVRESLIGI